MDTERCRSCPIHTILGMAIPVGVIREAMELAVQLIPMLHAEKNLVGRPSAKKLLGKLGR
jgi:hypothetical protein